MIRLTRLNHKEIAINCDLIEWVESKPDTTVRLVCGESILVLEPVSEVIQKITEYRRTLLAAAGLAAILTSGWKPTAALLRRDEEGNLTGPEDEAPEPQGAGGES